MLNKVIWIFRRYTLIKNKKMNLKIHWSAYLCNYSKLNGNNSIGARVRIEHSTVDKYSYVVADTKITRATIGKFCSIGQECLIGGLAMHPLDNFSTHPSFYREENPINKRFFDKKIDFIDQGGVSIGNDVWIGARAIILDGINIGHGAVIAAGAVVTNDIPPYAIVGGVPAKIIKYRFDENIIKKLLKSEWYNLDEKNLKQLNFDQIKTQ